MKIQSYKELTSYGIRININKYRLDLEVDLALKQYFRQIIRLKSKLPFTLFYYDKSLIDDKYVTYINFLIFTTYIIKYV